MTESGMCIMHADSYLVETIGCLNNILDLFFNFFSIFFVDIKYMLLTMNAHI